MSVAGRGAARAAAVALACAAACLVHGSALGTYFAQDDITFLSRAAGLVGGDAGFRPLFRLAFRIEHAAFGLDPFGYHAVGLALHLLNTVGVFALALRLAGSTAAAGVAAILFAASSIAFTPLHWASGLGELLAGTLLLAATLLHLASHARGAAWRWAAAAIALAAMFVKESAAAWVLVVAFLEMRLHRREGGTAALLPAVAATVAFVVFGAGAGRTLDAAGAYAPDASPLGWARSLFTFLRWSVALHDPIPDRMALADPEAWRVGLPLLLALAVALWRMRRDPGRGAEVGVVWWLAFVLPVLPLTRHLYLYYLYVPWIGGAIALGLLARRLVARWTRPQIVAMAVAVGTAYVAVEAYNVRVRETATADGLPVDRTIRDAVLLRNSLQALREARLPPGTRVAFVNPVPRPRFDLVTGAPTRAEDEARRTSYLPLEAAFRGGETLRLFEPKIEYVGFAVTIPREWEDAECFLFDQRGRLRRLGRGQAALLRQAEIQANASQWAAAESTFRRVRALGDTLPAALHGQVVALTRIGRYREADSLAAEHARRWPDSLAARARAGYTPRRTR